MIEKYYKTVVCINDKYKSHVLPSPFSGGITVGKIYQVTERDVLGGGRSIYYRIIDDLGRNFFYGVEQFIDLSDAREVKLEQIINT